MMSFQRLACLASLLLPSVTRAATPDAEIHVEGKVEYATFASFGSRHSVAGELALPPAEIDARLCDESLNYSSISWEGDVMLVPRGNCTFALKALAAKQMGAFAIVVYNTLESRYKQNGTSLLYPIDKADYECDNGLSSISSLVLDPPMYNGSYHDAFLTFDSPDNLCQVQEPSRCESRRCLVTGPANTTTGAFEACCAWDIPSRMGPDANLEANAVDDIVAVFVTMRQGQDLLSLVSAASTSNLTVVAIQGRPVSAWNASMFLLWLLAIFIVTLASWYSVRDYRRAKHKWQVCFQESIERHLLQLREEQQRRQTLSTTGEQQPLPQEEQTTDDPLEDDQGLEGLNEENEVSCPVEQQDVVGGHADDIDVEPSTTPQDTEQASEQARVADEENQDAPPRRQQAATPTRPSTNQALELRAWHAVGFVVVASTLLLVLFYFQIYSWVTILYGIGCSGAIAQLIFQPSYSWIGRRAKLLAKCCFSPITSATCCELNTVQWVNVYAALSGYLIGAMWLYVGFTDDAPSLNPFYWITQNVMGACVSILFLSLIRLGSIKVATILLIAVFIYDIFFVFISPFLFNGDNVMVTVATGGGPPERGEDFCEKYPRDAGCQGGNPLPLLLTIPRINDYRGGSSLLGLGDIVLPGLLLAFGARLDEARRLVGSLTNRNVNNVPKHIYQGYLFPLIVAYAFGLLAANIAVVLMKRGQPALLYLVPACLGTTFVVGRHELPELWRGPEVIGLADRITRLSPNASSLRVTQQEPEGNDEATTNTEQATTISGSVRSIT